MGWFSNNWEELEILKRDLEKLVPRRNKMVCTSCLHVEIVSVDLEWNYCRKCGSRMKKESGD